MSQEYLTLAANLTDVITSLRPNEIADRAVSQGEMLNVIVLGILCYKKRYIRDGELINIDNSNYLSPYVGLKQGSSSGYLARKFMWI